MKALFRITIIDIVILRVYSADVVELFGALRKVVGSMSDNHISSSAGDDGPASSQAQMDI